MGYAEVYNRSVNDPEGFWGEAAEGIDWYKPYDRVLDDSRAPFYHWFAGGELNTCYNAVDRHVESGRGKQAAIIYDSPVTQNKQTITYAQLQQQVSLFAGGLARLGVEKGDRVIIYMPMIPEALVAMLACARLGAIHSVVFGGFSSNELATRINDAKPKVLVAASCGIEPNRVVPYKPLLDKAFEMAEHKPDHCVVLQRPQGPGEMTAGRDVEWNESIDDVEPHPCVPVKATDPLYILYTSGTTGKPKGVVRDNGGHAVALNWSMKNIYGMEPGEVFWAASDVGWVVGHSYIVYAPLLYGCTTVVYEGKPVGTPDPGAFWRVIEEYQVSVMFTAPTAFRAIKKEDSKAEHLKRYDMSKFRALFLAGERCDPDTLGWAQEILERPVIDHWWQTETGWPIAANYLGIEQFPIRPGTAGKPVPGYNVQILDDHGEPVPAGQMGRIMIKLPLPPACLPTLWQNDQRFQEAYLSAQPGYYLTGDSGYLDEEGFLYVMGRIDDTINVAGHRLSTGAMEEVLASHPAVAECAVIGVQDTLKGSLPMGLVVMKSGVEQDEESLRKELVAQVRDQIGPVAAFKLVAVVKRLPKTRSGKILRAIMRKIADNEPFQAPATIDDPAILDEIRENLTGIGYAEGKKG
ncbi:MULTISPECIES: propionyl-CoA synthetase [unclassified Ectothiorhodospira]|uniref:propionyl-CoA synthetase n=1 Tax=unclassified Ectothiorhodospira TaxID=2684909 RepID=UPI001EE8343F|nr:MULTISPECIES: propionyl-CoA synthetase [unclassified Ectothiorhodospira]MCG5514667.1 propionyl-CoA synthetase [Ectothiorhodospira sp. 9100]MCG5517959.1 propionyl-CoA synthetase [Ectothiorhodospira sp. 9905]